MNRRYPRYPDDADYQTNSPSYYDDLARKQKLIEMLAKKIWEYEETLDLTLEEISERLESYIKENDNLMNERLEQWDLNLEKFPENVELLLQEWLSDGTLDHIINETIFNWKADKSYVDSEIERLDQKDENIITQLAQTTTDYLNLGKEKEGGVPEKDNYQDLVNLVNNVKKENKGLYIPNGNYYVSEDLTIEGIENIRIDGEITMAEGKVFEILYDSRFTDPLVWNINRINGHLRLTGIKNGNIRVSYADKLELYADRNDVKRSSIAYSQFYLGTITELSIFSPNTGWINENIFFGGRINELLIDGKYSHNNNTFLKPMLENSIIRIKRGTSNRFYDVRFEADNTIICDEGTFNNIIYRTWYSLARNTISTLSDAVTMNDRGYNRLVKDTTFISRELINVNKYNINDKLTVNGDKVVTTSYNNFIETDLIKLPDFSFGLDFISDVTGLRGVIHFYDSNRDLIQGENPEIIDSPALIWGGEYYRVTTDGVSEFSGFVRNNTNAVYFSLGVYFGKNTEFENVSILMNTLSDQPTLMKEGIQYSFSS